MTKYIAFLGETGSYSHLACRHAAPDCDPLPCQSFEDVFAAVREGRADFGILPIENSIAGRVADVHYLLPNGGLTIVAEHYQPIVHHLLGMPDATLDDIKVVHSHVQGLSQCRSWLRAHNITTVIKGNTALAAAELSQQIKDKSIGVIASEMAGETYGLKSLAGDIADMKANTTRFLILAAEPRTPALDSGPCVTTLLFRVRSVPAALYKALGGFATNGINITKLESYLVDGQFTAAQFYIDVDGHPDQIALKNALEELRFFAQKVIVMGTYPASPFRQQG